MANQQSSKRSRARQEGGVEAASYRIKGPKDFLLEGVTDILQKILQTAGWGGELTSVALSKARVELGLLYARFEKDFVAPADEGIV